MNSQDPLICVCLGVSKSRIVKAIEGGAHSVDEVRQETQACMGCQSCYCDIEALISEHAPKSSGDAAQEGDDAQ